MRNFIRQYRTEIDQHIKKVCPNIKSLNDKDRQEWILNDEGLYNWARQEKVNI